MAGAVVALLPGGALLSAAARRLACRVPGRGAVPGRARRGAAAGRCALLGVWGVRYGTAGRWALPDYRRGVLGATHFRGRRHRVISAATGWVGSVGREAVTAATGHGGHRHSGPTGSAGEAMTADLLARSSLPYAPAVGSDCGAVVPDRAAAQRAAEGATAPRGTTGDGRGTAHSGPLRAVQRRWRACGYRGAQRARDSAERALQRRWQPFGIEGHRQRTAAQRELQRCWQPFGIEGHSGHDTAHSGALRRVGVLWAAVAHRPGRGPLPAERAPERGA